jgi:hypothetical protein
MCDPFLDAFIIFSKTSHKNRIVCKYSKQKMMVVDLGFEVSQHGHM